MCISIDLEDFRVQMLINLYDLWPNKSRQTKGIQNMIELKNIKKSITLDVSIAITIYLVCVCEKWKEQTNFIDTDLYVLHDSVS